MGGLEVLSVETLQRYFNFGAYGRDLAIGDYSKQVMDISEIFKG